MVGMQPVTPPATRSTPIGRSSPPDDIGPGPSASAVRMPEGAAPAHRPLPADPPDPRLFRFLWGMTGDVAVAEELEQEARLMAWHRHGDLRDPDKSGAWLYRIATNAAMDELRRRKRRPWDVLGLTNLLRAPSPSEDERLSRVVLDQALLRIGAEHRAVISLFEYAGLTAPQVAEVLGITPEAARKRRQRAREALAAVLGAERGGRP